MKLDKKNIRIFICGEEIKSDNGKNYFIKFLMPRRIKFKIYFFHYSGIIKYILKNKMKVKFK